MNWVWNVARQFGPYLLWGEDLRGSVLLPDGRGRPSPRERFQLMPWPGWFASQIEGLPQRLKAGLIEALIAALKRCAAQKHDCRAFAGRSHAKSARDFGCRVPPSLLSSHDRKSPQGENKTRYVNPISAEVVIAKIRVRPLPSRPNNSPAKESERPI